MTAASPSSARLRAGFRFFLVVLVAHVVAALVLLPPTARWIAPLGFLVPGPGPRAALVSLLLDLPLVLVAAPAAWILGRVGEGPPARRAAVLVLLLWLLDALSGLFVNQNFDRWLDLWSAAARTAAMIGAWALARHVLRRAEPSGTRPQLPVAPPRP